MSAMTTSLNRPAGTESVVNVSKLGYVGFETPDVDRMVSYYTTVLDFTLVDQSPQGAFLTTGFDHHCIVITKGDKEASLGRRLRNLGITFRRRNPSQGGRLRGGTPQ
jgi:catechol 2,3-dioxygenase-like lactoylglutathione lyase family enzyme